MSNSRVSFFRQSGWLLIASNLGGGLMWLVHTVARKMGEDQYSQLTTLFQSLILIGSAGTAIQIVFAQQTAAAVSDEARARLAHAARRVMLGLLAIWLVASLGIGIFSQGLLADFRISGLALALTAVFALFQLWIPVPTGMLQGRQNFLWLGWAGVLNGAGRLVAVLLIVWVFSGQAAGGMVGALVGMGVGFAIALWHTRDLFRGRGAEIDWPEWLRDVMPLALGSTATALVLTADVVFVRRFFSGEESAYYNAAGMIGRALAAFTAPLTAVMFPKVVAAAARSEKTDALALALGATALLGVCAAVACTVLPELPIRLIQGEKYLPAAALIPKLGWCVLPFTLANVLINNLLARRRYVIVPWLLVIAVGYVGGLFYFGSTLPNVIYTLGGFGTLLLAVSAWFTWRK